MYSNNISTINISRENDIPHFSDECCNNIFPLTFSK